MNLRVILLKNNSKTFWPHQLFHADSFRASEFDFCRSLIRTWESGEKFVFSLFQCFSNNQQVTKTCRPEKLIPEFKKTVFKVRDVSTLNFCFLSLKLSQSCLSRVLLRGNGVLRLSGCFLVLAEFVSSFCSLSDSAMGDKQRRLRLNPVVLLFCYQFPGEGCLCFQSEVNK